MIPRFELDESLFSAHELRVVHLLAEAWNCYVELEKQHPMEQSEFCSAIHRCQDLVLIRAIRKRIEKP